MPRRIEVVIFDMDGVLTVNTSSWELLHKCMGTHPSLKACRFSEAFLKGLITYRDWMRLDLEIMISSYGKEVSIEELKRRLYRGVIIDPYAKFVVEGLKNMGIKVGIVSAGIDVVAYYVGKLLGIDERNIYVNKLVVNERGLIRPEGLELVNPLRKCEILRDLSRKMNTPLSRFAYVGDTSWDINAFRKVGYPILYVRNAIDRLKENDENLHRILIPGMIVVTKLVDLLDIIKKVNEM